MGSTTSGDSPVAGRRSTSIPNTPAAEHPPSLEDLEMEENRLRQQEDEEVARRKQAAEQLVQQKGLRRDNLATEGLEETKPEVAEDESYPPQAREQVIIAGKAGKGFKETSSQKEETRTTEEEGSAQEDAFVPARLPFF
ncbi:hypothetical protein LIA77_02161 [Sarocladium implicatum]|nr:hypothetical protein LIA77_02161 [Sarocladium implicatum]